MQLYRDSGFGVTEERLAFDQVFSGSECYQTCKTPVIREKFKPWCQSRSDADYAFDAVDCFCLSPPFAGEHWVS